MGMHSGWIVMGESHDRQSGMDVKKPGTKCLFCISPFVEKSISC